MDGNRTVIIDDNYVLVFEGARPNKEQVETELKALPNKRSTSLPAILTFLPREGLVPNSARYVLGPASLAAFAPELVAAQAGIRGRRGSAGGEYRVGKSGAPFVWRFSTIRRPKWRGCMRSISSGCRTCT